MIVARYSFDFSGKSRTKEKEGTNIHIYERRFISNVVFSVEYFMSIMAEGTKENGNSNRWKPLSTGIKSLLIPVIESRRGSTYFRNSLITLK